MLHYHKINMFAKKKRQLSVYIYIIYRLFTSIKAILTIFFLYGSKIYSVPSFLLFRKPRYHDIVYDIHFLSIVLYKLHLLPPSLLSSSLPLTYPFSSKALSLAFYPLRFSVIPSSRNCICTS